MREVSRVTSLILRAKPWSAKKTLRHGNRFASRVRRRSISGGREVTTGIASAVRRLHLGKQIAFFICLFAGPNYDLNCDSVCSPLCSIHLIKKSSELRQEGKLLKPILLSWLIRALWSLLSPRDKIPSVVFMHEPQLITGWAPGTTVLRNTWTEEHCLSLESSLKRSLPSQNRAKYLTLQLPSKIFFTEGYIFLWLNAINLYSDWIAFVFPIFFKFASKRTRSNHNYKLQVKSANCNCYKYSFFVKIIREWNDLPANVVEIGNLRRFKIALKSYMRIS